MLCAQYSPHLSFSLHVLLASIRIVLRLRLCVEQQRIVGGARTRFVCKQYGSCGTNRDPGLGLECIICIPVVHNPPHRPLWVSQRVRPLGKALVCGTSTVPLRTTPFSQIGVCRGLLHAPYGICTTWITFKVRC
eukprot:1159320-Pelagomonas_calceolata.AAC.7